MAKDKATNSNKALIMRSLYAAGMYTVPIVKLRWKWLLANAVANVLLESYFQALIDQYQYVPSLQLVGHMGMAASALLTSAIVLFLAPITIEDIREKRRLTSVWEFSNRFIWPLTLEGFRALTQILLWAILFLIPGVYKSIRLHFVAYVVMFDPEYDAGNVDALKRSNELSRGIFWWLLLLLVAALGIELGLDTPASLADGPLHYALRAATAPLTVIFSVYSVNVSFLLFQKLHQAKAA